MAARLQVGEQTRTDSVALGETMRNGRLSSTESLEVI
jgi:hypothetical protein